MFLHRLAILAVGLGLPASILGQTVTPHQKIDERLQNVLRIVHDRGAALYNTNDPEGCYRLFEGALLTARPLLEHQPAIQKRIDQGMEAMENEDSFTRRAFMLHELIEAVRADLREFPSNRAPTPPIPPAKNGQARPAPIDSPTKPMTEPPRPPKAQVEPLGIVPKTVDTPPPVTQNDANRLVCEGRVTLSGEPLRGAKLWLVASDLKFFIYRATTDAAGQYRIESIPEGIYTVVIDGPEVAEKYRLTSTSPLRVQVPGEANIGLSRP